MEQHPIWHLFDLHVTTPRLELRAITDDLAVQLAQLAAQGIHEPNFMPFGIPWTDQPSPKLEEGALQFYWRCRAEMSPEKWNINFAVFDDGELVGTSGMFAFDFPKLRQFETGSWLGRRFQGRGIGKEMRIATLHVGFVGLGATRATTGAWQDNGPSLGVTRSFGYEPNGVVRKLRRDQADEMIAFKMEREHFDAHLRREDIVVHGAEACLPILGLV